MGKVHCGLKPVHRLLYTNFWCVLMHTDQSNGGPSWDIQCWTTSFISIKKAGRKLPRRSQSRGKEPYLSAVIPAQGACCAYTLHTTHYLLLTYTLLLLIKVSMIFNQCDSALLFRVQFGRIRFTPHCAHFLGYSARNRLLGQSKDRWFNLRLLSLLDIVWGWLCKALKKYYHTSWYHLTSRCVQPCFCSCLCYMHVFLLVQSRSLLT